MKAKTWRRRYFILDRPSGLLRYFEDEGKVEKGVVALSGCTVNRRPTKLDEKFRIFGWLMQEGSGGHSYAIRADTLEDKSMWIDALEECIRDIQRAQDAYAKQYGDGAVSPITSPTTSPRGP